MKAVFALEARFATNCPAVPFLPGPNSIGSAGLNLSPLAYPTLPSALAWLKYCNSKLKFGSDTHHRWTAGNYQLTVPISTFAHIG
jgi:hypothetical protein